ncbi:hypothetical protein [Hymenobacter psychrotolerans]|uniref:DUF4062 domain-containing protein n=1 Tax=Hymenobacter psychrotolerans DSM 18569 TaxID=1121959 RepID=A0A1M7E9Z8_9BACT|nr:hypothetical protein [Hymenobacter psychrotolerans]SHL88601.1 hypothetical protein SAMN02746009_03568 [Hymenobacter psychrotolerans DSM 18569]
MSFEAKVFNVMIASPGDVPEERQAVRDVLYAWNAVHADERKQVLLPVGWETHAAPDMSGPPQSIINKVALNDCDLLVGIFWTRIGTATAEYVSGAVEEIERHIAAGKPAMLYFSEAPIKPDSINSKQYKQLQKFKSYCRPKGLYEGFVSTDDFKSKFKDQLQLILKTHFRAINTIDSYKIDRPSINEKEVASVLSADEQVLLKAASSDKHGAILKVKMSDGTYIQTNNRHIIQEQSAREIARWIGALDSLCRKDYVRAVGHKGQMFELTAAGFALADTLLVEDSSNS